MLLVLNSGWENFHGSKGRQEAVVFGEMRFITCNTKTGVNMHQCVHVAFWGCLKSKEPREENVVRFSYKRNIVTHIFVLL